MCSHCHKQFQMPTPEEQAELMRQQLEREEQERRGELMGTQQQRRHELMRAQQEADNRYPALQALAAVCKIIAILVLAICLIGILVVINTDIPEGVKGQSIILLAICLVLAPLGLWATAELMVLFIHIEYNTRITRQEVAKQRQKTE